jgi:chemotaxis regulatin CheY-phosphate phosphatase CheZ
MTATWRAYDGLESRMARVGGDVADFLEHGTEHGLMTQEQHADVMAVAQDLQDRMRSVVRTAREVVQASRGFR